MICQECGNLSGSRDVGSINPAARYRLFYDLVLYEENQLKQAHITAEYNLCKALAACYELQDYLANRLAEYGFD